MWLDIELSDRSEYNVSVGAVIVSVDNSRIQLVDDDKQVCHIHVSCHVIVSYHVFSSMMLADFDHT